MRTQQKISDLDGVFSGVLDDSDAFGVSVAALGDLDADGVVDLAVGASGDDDGGPGRGAVWILFLNPDGTVKADQKISNTDGGFLGVLDDSDSFGFSVARLGDLDGDGNVDIAVGAIGDDDGGVILPADRGAVWILFLNGDGTVRSHQKISDTQGGFAGSLDDGDFFGSSLACLPDLDGDGVVELAVGAILDDDGCFHCDNGAVWILFLNGDGTVRAHQKISAAQGGFIGDFGANLPVYFGSSVASLGDLDGDGVEDLAVGAELDGSLTLVPGATWILFLNPDGTVKGQRKISDGVGGFTGAVDDGELFGASLAGLGDLDGDGTLDLAVGAGGDRDGGPARGAVWILFLRADGTAECHRKISNTEGAFRGALEDFDYFGGDLLGGSAVAPLGDLDGDGFTDLAVGAPRDDDGGPDRGAVWVLFLGREKTRYFPGTVRPGGTVVLPLVVHREPCDGIVEPPVTRTAVPVIPLMVVGRRPSPSMPSGRGPWARLLVDPGSIVGLFAGPPWSGGAPPAVELSIPNDPALLGQRFYAQGLRFQTSGLRLEPDAYEIVVE